MSTKKIREALVRMAIEAQDQKEWGSVNLATAALVELTAIERAARTIAAQGIYELPDGEEEEIENDINEAEALMAEISHEVESREAFDEKTAFAKIARTYSDLRELLRALGKLRYDNLHLLPVGYSAENLMDLGQDRGWIVEQEDGSFTIEVR